MSFPSSDVFSLALVKLDGRNVFQGFLFCMMTVGLGTGLSRPDYTLKSAQERSSTQFLVIPFHFRLALVRFASAVFSRTNKSIGSVGFHRHRHLPLTSTFIHSTIATFSSEGLLLTCLLAQRDELFLLSV